MKTKKKVITYWIFVNLTILIFGVVLFYLFEGRDKHIQEFLQEKEPMTAVILMAIVTIILSCSAARQDLKNLKEKWVLLSRDSHKIKLDYPVIRYVVIYCIAIFFYFESLNFSNANNDIVSLIRFFLIQCFCFSLTSSHNPSKTFFSEKFCCINTVRWSRYSQ